MKRKHISWKTKCAAALAVVDRLRHDLYISESMFSYDQLKQMTEEKFLSRWEFDHNILHSSEHKDRDKFWNLTPMPREEHREKTKQDAKVIAKSRRIRAWNDPPAQLRGERVIPKRKITSRGFDKTLRKKMSGKVVPR
jgi:hypothetical protein